MTRDILAVVIASIPVWLLLFSLMNRVRGKCKRINWLWPGVSFVILLFFFLVISISYKMKYDIPILASIEQIKIPLIAAGFIFIVFGAVFLIRVLGSRLDIRAESEDKPRLNPAPVIFFPGYILFIAILVLPFGAKMDYAQELKGVMELSEWLETKSEFFVIRSDSKESCSGQEETRVCEYENRFFVKNNSDETKVVKINIYAFNESRRIEKKVISEVMQIEPGELKLVTTKETNKDDEPWLQWSFKSDRKIVAFQDRFEFGK